MIKRRVHVAAAAVIRGDGRVLIARRPATVDQGGLWEFPGGKLAPYETGLEALKRELNEELGIQIVRAQPLIRVHHEYADKHILLDVWQVREYDGDPYGREGQPVRWVEVDDLPNYPFPAANMPILRAVALPQEYLITAEADDDVFLARLERALKEDGVRLVQLRAKELDDAAYQARAQCLVDDEEFESAPDEQSDAVGHVSGCQQIERDQRERQRRATGHQQRYGWGADGGAERGARQRDGGAHEPAPALRHQRASDPASAAAPIPAPDGPRNNRNRYNP